MFYEITVNSWSRTLSLFKKITENDTGWAFRGQSDKKMDLSTKFEREAAKYRCDDPYWYKNRERYILWDFKRRAHHYVQNLPKQKKNIEWLSLIQHHGGPTRLLDFTYSTYVALFFSVETSKTDSVVWAVNTRRLLDKLSEKDDYNSIKNEKMYDIVIEKNIQWAESVIKNRSNKDVVFIIEPFQQHERISIQQGLFLFPGNIEKPFESNICSVFELPFENLSTKNALKIKFSEIAKLNFENVSVLKIVIPSRLHPKGILELRNMNITAATLFPGLDGFARSLYYRFPELYCCLNHNSP